MGRGIALVALAFGLVAAGASPAAGTSLSGVTQLDAASSMTCAVLADTTARCWGNGALGNGEGFGQTSATPVVVEDESSEPLTGIQQIAVAGGHVCVLLGDATVRCWGENLVGELGDGTITPRLTPVTVEVSTGVALAGVAEIAVGDYFSCARLTNGQARCWGQNGALGDGTNSNRRRPVAVKNPAGTGPLTNVAQIVTGSRHTCARLTNGQARCWGGSGGPIGDGTTMIRSRPVTVVAVSGPGAADEHRRAGGRRAEHLRPADERSGPLLGPQQRRPAR